MAEELNQEVPSSELNLKIAVLQVGCNMAAAIDHSFYAFLDCRSYEKARTIMVTILKCAYKWLRKISSSTPTTEY